MFKIPLDFFLNLLKLLDNVEKALLGKLLLSQRLKLLRKVRKTKRLIERIVGENKAK